MSKVVISMTGHGRGTVVIDGVKVDSVTDVRFRASSGKLNKVLLVVLADQIEVTGEPEGSGAVVEVTTMRSESREWRRR